MPPPRSLTSANALLVCLLCAPAGSSDGSSSAGGLPPQCRRGLPGAAAAAWPPLLLACAQRQPLCVHALLQHNESTARFHDRRPDGKESTHALHSMQLEFQEWF